MLEDYGLRARRSLALPAWVTEECLLGWLTEGVLVLITLRLWALMMVITRLSVGLLLSGNLITSLVS